MIISLPESKVEKWHHLKVQVKNGNVYAYVDGNLRINQPVDFTGYSILGITASTGEGVNLHKVKNISVGGLYYRNQWLQY